MTLPLDPFRPEQSRLRAKILYDILKPHLRDGLSYIDIGCAYGILEPHIRQDFPASEYLGFDADASTIEFCRNNYPRSTWEHAVIMPAVHYSALWLFHKSQTILYQDRLGETVIGKEELIQRHYNIILHLANDSWQHNDLWKIHLWLTRRKLEEPTVVLLESGWRENYDGPLVTMREIEKLYVSAGLSAMQKGEFRFECQDYNKNRRFYSLLGRR